MNLSIISSFTDGIMCRPEFISQDSAECPFLELRDARHPCVTASRSENSQSFISNDTVIGIAENKASLLLLTGVSNFHLKSIFTSHL